jgi:hypothetical protein
VLDHRKSEEKGSQRHGQVSADDRQDSQGERDVGCDRDRPTLERAVANTGVERNVDQRGHDHPTNGSGDWQCRPSWIAQVAGNELALKFQPRDEEENREQPVSGPLGQR